MSNIRTHYTFTQQQKKYFLRTFRNNGTIGPPTKKQKNTQFMQFHSEREGTNEKVLACKV